MKTYTFIDILGTKRVITAHTEMQARSCLKHIMVVCDKICPGRADLILGNSTVTVQK